MANEIRAFCEAILGRPEGYMPPEGALLDMQIVEATRESAAREGERIAF